MSRAGHRSGTRATDRTGTSWQRLHTRYRTRDRSEASRRWEPRRPDDQHSQTSLSERGGTSSGKRRKCSWRRAPAAGREPAHGYEKRSCGLSSAPSSYGPVSPTGAGPSPQPSPPCGRSRSAADAGEVLSPDAAATLSWSGCGRCGILTRAAQSRAEQCLFRHEHLNVRREPPSRPPQPDDAGCGGRLAGHFVGHSAGHRQALVGRGQPGESGFSEEVISEEVISEEVISEEVSVQRGQAQAAPRPFTAEALRSSLP